MNYFISLFALCFLFSCDAVSHANENLKKFHKIEEDIETSNKEVEKKIKALEEELELTNLIDTIKSN